MSSVSGTGQYTWRPETKQCFLRSLGELRNLRILALEYSHLADGTGGSLLSLLPVIKRPHFRLQLMCRECHIPGRTDAALGAGGYEIPDTAWRRVIIACPDLYLMIVFFRVRDYDNIRRFLKPSMGIREVHWQFGIDLKMRQRQDSDFSCFVRHIAYRYADTLTTVSIHQWRFAVFPLRKVFEFMPRLVRFFYVGRVEDEVDLRRLLQIVSCGVCNIRVRDYDNIRRFLKPSMGIREVHWQFGIDLKMRQRQDSDFSCFVRHIAYRYADTLTTVSIHQWRFAVFPLRKVFEFMPRLVRFFYVGRVEDEVDLRRLLQIVSCGVCNKLKQVKIQIQDDEKRRSYWEAVVMVLMEEFSEIVKLYDINLCLSIYKN